MDLCGKVSGFADFENTVDRGSVVIFDADSGLDHKSFFSLVGMLMSSSKLFLFSKEVHLSSNGGTDQN